MNTKLKPESLILKLLDRSTCKVQVAAIIADSHGIYSWGWNSSGNGYGIHAEIHAIKRANPKRLPQSTLYVIGRRLKSGNYVDCKPCENCMKEVVKCRKVIYRRKDRWVEL